MPIHSIKKRSFRQEREFGLLVGGIFALLGGWWIFREKFYYVARVFLPIGSIGVLLGLFAPALLTVPRRWWMAMAEGISFVTTRIILAVVFFVVVTPIGWIKRLTGWDPLRRRSKTGESYWEPYPAKQKDPRHYEKMF